MWVVKEIRLWSWLNANDHSAIWAKHVLILCEWSSFLGDICNSFCHVTKTCLKCLWKGNNLKEWVDMDDIKVLILCPSSNGDTSYIHVLFLHRMGNQVCNVGNQVYSVGNQVCNVGNQVYNVGNQVCNVGNQVYNVGNQVYNVGNQVYNVGNQVYNVGNQVCNVGNQVYNVGNQVCNVGNQVCNVGNQVCNVGNQVCNVGN